MADKVAVVGLGPQGLLAVKNLKEDGFDVVGFDAKPQVGGLWTPTAEPTISAHPTTAFNTSRYRAAFSDFPFPDGTSDFPTAGELCSYFEAYCDHFKLWPTLRLSTPVTAIRRVGSKWELDVVGKDGETSTEYFTKVAFATGTFMRPRIPTLEGINLFTGDVKHSIEYHDASPYKGKRVLLVGLHATTQDIAISLANSAKVYISHRSGVLLVPRYADDGATYDQVASLNFVFLQNFMSGWFPRFWNWFLTKFLVKMSKKAFPRIEEKWGFSPPPPLATTPPLVGDPLYELMEKGVAEPVNEIRRINGPRSVELKNGTVLQDLDAIIYCTGYYCGTPVTPVDINPYPVPGEPPQLYHGMIPLSPDPAIRTSLAFLGQIFVVLPGFVQHEMMVLSLSQIWQGKVKLPPYKQMWAWHKQHMRWWRNVKAYGQAHSRHGLASNFYEGMTEMPNHFKWLDETAGTGLYSHFGWFKWRAWRFWWSDKPLYYLVKSGVFTPTIWRLFDMGRRKPWGRAREQIFKDNEDANAQRERKKQEDMQRNVNKA